eukprot:364999-Chlamydomonas_euryale.AAC.25
MTVARHAAAAALSVEPADRQRAAQAISARSISSRASGRSDAASAIAPALFSLRCRNYQPRCCTRTLRACAPPPAAPPAHLAAAAGEEQEGRGRARCGAVAEASRRADPGGRCRAETGRWQAQAQSQFERPRPPTQTSPSRRIAYTCQNVGRPRDSLLPTDRFPCARGDAAAHGIAGPRARVQGADSSPTAQLVPHGPMSAHARRSCHGRGA